MTSHLQVYMSESINSEIGFLAWECGSSADFEVGNEVSKFHKSLGL